MRSRGLRTGVALLICSAVLLAAIAPPAVHHAHAAGDQPHHHGAHGHESHYNHQHAHASCQASHQHVRPDDPQPAPVLEPHPVAHLHVTLLGFVFYLPSYQSPLSDAPSESPADEHAPAESSISLVRLAGSEAVWGATADAVQPLGVGSTHPPVPASQPVLRSRPQGERAMLRALPLCDSARLERSGVRLI